MHIWDFKIMQIRVGWQMDPTPLPQHHKKWPRTLALTLGLLGLFKPTPPTGWGCPFGLACIFLILITELFIWYDCLGISIVSPNMYLTLILVKYCCNGPFMCISVLHNLRILACTQKYYFYIQWSWTNLVIMLWLFAIVWYITKLV